jgi:DNA-binding CsgD family transcriptional regulator
VTWQIDILPTAAGSRLSWRCYTAHRIAMPTYYYREVIMLTSGTVPGPSSFTPHVKAMLPEAEIWAWKPSELSSAAAGVEFSGGVPDELSTRELEVLRYLATMLTAGEIAAELYVSVNTIKAHTRSIYRKLGASRRQEAVVRAYECGVLRPRSFVHPATNLELNQHS